MVMMNDSLFIVLLSASLVDRGVPSVLEPRGGRPAESPGVDSCFPVDVAAGRVCGGACIGWRTPVSGSMKADRVTRLAGTAAWSTEGGLRCAGAGRRAEDRLESCPTAVLLVVFLDVDGRRADLLISANTIGSLR